MDDNRVRVISTNEEFKIIADPFRLKIIDVYVEQGIPLTVKMVADLIDEVPAKVHYHVQKLIKINILALDHIEVINGINAKYYILMKDSFRFDIKQDNSNKMKSFQIDSTMNLLNRSLDTFKDEIIKIAENAKNKGKIDKDEAFLSRRNIYLTNEERNELKEYIINYLDEHSTPNEDKIKYIFLSSIIKKVD